MLIYSGPEVRILVGEEPPAEKPGVLMEFRLTYAGKLASTGNNNGHHAHKHDLRKHFHKQLKHFWEIHPGLSSLATAQHFAHREAYVKRTANNFQLGPFSFVPMVTEQLSLLCDLNILLLTRGSRSGKVIKSGDIDGRLKTLFDSLRRPTQMQEIDGFSPSEDENPLYCLLEDDSLITHVAVTTDHLLEPIPRDDRGGPRDTDARLIINVKLGPYAGPAMNEVFI